MIKMLEIIDVLFLVFVYATLFITFFFLILHSEHKKERLEGDFFPSVSVIIPAYNEEKTIVSTVNAVKRLDYPNILEVLVVDDGSSDRTGELAKQAGARVLRKENQGRKSYALNHALKNVRGELIVCIDADSYPEPDSLKKAVRHFQDKDVAAVTISIFVKNPKNIVERLQNIEYVLISWARKLLEMIDGIYVTPGALSMYRTDIIRDVGGFDNENLTEDMEIAWRLLYKGYKIKMSLDSEVYTSVPKTFKKWWYQRVRWSVGGIQTILKYWKRLLEKQTGLLKFVAVLFLLMHVFSITGFFIFVYLSMKSTHEFLYYTYNAFVSGAPLIEKSIFDAILLPNIFFLFGILILTLSVVWVVISYKSTNKHLAGLTDLFILMIYLTIYITLFPIILFHAVSRIVRNKIVW